MTNPFLGELRLMSFNFAPKGWAFANGQTLSIQQNAALFSLFGTTYGGNGVTTFLLPNMQGNVPMHFGTGLGGEFFTQGQVGGSSNVTLTQQQMPQHSHAFMGTTSQGVTQKAFNAGVGNQIGKTSTNNVYDAAFVASNASGQTALNPASIQTAGGSQPHNNLQPYLTITMCVALQGIFPSRN